MAGKLRASRGLGEDFIDPNFSTIDEAQAASAGYTATPPATSAVVTPTLGGFLTQPLLGVPLWMWGLGAYLVMGRKGRR